MAGGVPAGRLNIEVVAELARITQDMEKIKKVVNNAAGDIAKSARHANDNLAGMAGGIGKAGTQSKLASHHMANLSFQLQDIVVGLQGGQKPMTVFLQQGGQIGQIMAQAGLGVGGLAKAVGSMVFNFAKAHPVLVALAVAAGGAAVSLKVVANQLNKEHQAELEAYAKSLGLTTKQIEDAGGAAVTSADLIGALWDKVAEVIALEGMLDDLNSWFLDTFNSISANVRKNVAEIYAAIQTIDDILEYVGKHGGEMFAEGLINGLNAGIKAINSFGTIYGAGGEVLWSPNIGLIENEYAGAGEKASQSFQDSYAGHLSKAGAWIGDAYADVLEGAVGKARGRLLGALDKDEKKLKEKSNKRAEALAREFAATESLIAGLYDLAAAYRVSDAAAMHAEIVAKATAQGMQKQADVAAFVAQQLRKAVAERVVATAKMASDLRFQADTQELANQSIRDGTLAIEDAADALALYRARRDAIAALELAEMMGDPETIREAARALDDLTDAQNRNLQSARQFADLQQSAQIAKDIEDIQLETKLMKDLGAARIAVLQGASGSLEDDLARIAAEHEKIAIQAHAEVEAARLLKAGYDDAAKAVLLKAEADKTQVDARLEIEEQIRAIEILNDRMDALLSTMSRMGGLGGILGDIGGILTDKNPIAAMMGMGGIGTILGSVLDRGATAEAMGKQFSESLRKTMPGINEKLAVNIGSIMANFTQGAAIGGAVHSIAGGSSTGSQIGGGIGGALGSALGPLGSIAGSIVGSLLGGLVGGLVSSTKRGGATIGAGGITGTWGNSDQRISAASQMGKSGIDALEQLAGALGTTLGDFSSSISVREGNLRFDPTGSGISKTSKGAIDFGQDEEALLKAFIADAIRDGGFKGLSQGFKDYLTSGDVEKRLQDVLSLRGALDELKQIKDPQGFALGELDKVFEELRRIATATGEGLAEIEELYGLKRKEILEQVGEDMSEIERRHKELNIELLVAQGKAEEALAGARALELEGLDDISKALKNQIWALQDAAIAEAELAQAREVAKQAAQALTATNRALEIEITRLLDPLHALKLEREDELRVADATTRALLLHKYALEDEAVAAAEASAALERIASERFGLETRLLQLQGDTAALRDREREALDPANRALLDMIFALEDVQTAAAEAAQAAAELAAQQKAIVDEIGGLNRQWLELTGQTAKIREMDLAALLSDEARAIQQQIWDYTDALEAQKAAQEAAAQAAGDYTRRLADARNVLSQAYERESGALQQTIDKFRGFAASIREFRDGLIGGTNGALGFRKAQGTFRNTSRMAQFGEEGALGRFTGDAQAYIDAARSQASTFTEFQRIVAEVSRGAGLAERGASGVASEAQLQLDKMTAIVEGLGLLREDSVSFGEALTDYNRALTERAIPAFTDTVGVGLSNVTAEIKQTREEGKSERQDRQAAEVAMIGMMSDLKDLTQRMLVAIEDEGIVVSGTVTVGNTSANPVPVDTTP